jgi:hypothetical protein
MAAVCSDCPVIVKCARYARSGTKGGFYAGVWLPWDKTNSTTLRENRHRAQAALRHVGV